MAINPLSIQIWGIGAWRMVRSGEIGGGGEFWGGKFGVGLVVGVSLGEVGGREGIPKLNPQEKIPHQKIYFFSAYREVIFAKVAFLLCGRGMPKQKQHGKKIFLELFIGDEQQQNLIECRQVIWFACLHSIFMEPGKKNQT